MNVCSLLAALRADSGWEEEGEGHDWCWSIRCASCLSHSAVPQSLAPPLQKWRGPGMPWRGKETQSSLTGFAPQIKCWVLAFDTLALWSFWVAPCRETCQKPEHPESRGEKPHCHLLFFTSRRMQNTEWVLHGLVSSSEHPSSIAWGRKVLSWQRACALPPSSPHCRAGGMSRKVNAGPWEWRCIWCPSTWGYDFPSSDSCTSYSPG